MNKIGHLLCVLICAAAVSSAFAGKANEAAAKPMKFDMEMKMSMQGPPDKTGKPKKMDIPMTMRFWIKSKDKVRMEISSPMMAGKIPGGGSKQVTILSGDNIYQLNEAQKTAMKMKKPPQGSGMMSPGPIDPTTGVPDLKELEKKGFKKSGTAMVGKENCDIYKGKMNQGPMNADVTMWLRQSDHFPLKFDMKGTMQGGSFSGTGILKNIVMNPQLDDSMFKVPAGYKIQDMSQMMGKMGKMPPGKK